MLQNFANSIASRPKIRYNKETLAKKNPYGGKEVPEREESDGYAVPDISWEKKRGVCLLTPGAEYGA